MPSAMVEAALENDFDLEASADLEADDSATSVGVAEKEFLQMFLDLDEKVSTCGEELHRAVDAQAHSLKEELESLRENFLELVGSRSAELPKLLEEQKNLGKATGAGRSMSVGCFGRSEMEDRHSESRPSSTKRATSLNDAEKKLGSEGFPPIETEG